MSYDFTYQLYEEFIKYSKYTSMSYCALIIILFLNIWLNISVSILIFLGIYIVLFSISYNRRYCFYISINQMNNYAFTYSFIGLFFYPFIYFIFKSQMSKELNFIKK